MTAIAKRPSDVKRAPEGEYSVHRQRVDGQLDIVCSEVSASHAKQEFHRNCNNVSALSGITQRVILLDGLDQPQIAWEFGRGYIFVGGTPSDARQLPS